MLSDGFRKTGSSQPAPMPLGYIFGTLMELNTANFSIKLSTAKMLVELRSII